MQLIPMSAVCNWTMAGSARIPVGIGTVCPHCGQTVVFTLAELVEDGKRTTVSATGACPACKQTVSFWAVRHGQKPANDAVNPAAIYMYPAAKNYYPSPEFAPDIPEQLQRAFVSAIQAFNSKNYVATAVCARRTLEGIFKHLVPEHKKNAVLGHLINEAKSTVDLAAPLTSLSHAIRDGGNLGAHFNMEKEPSDVMARQMVQLLDYLISYLYVLPVEIKKLEEILGKDDEPPAPQERQPPSSDLDE